MKQTAESIEAEAALVRSQLVAVGADIRHHADPTVIVDAVKASFQRRTAVVPTLLKQNAAPVGMILLGGTIGALLTGLFSPSRRARSLTSKVEDAPRVDGVANPSLRSQANAALLSSVGVGLGYIAGMFIPTTSAEDRFLGQPKAVLSERLDDFLQQHTRDMKAAAANAFGISRLSATTLIGLALLAEALGISRQPANPDTL